MARRAKGSRPTSSGTPSPPHLIRNGVDIRTVQELMGHSELETTAKYLHSDTRTKQAAVGRLDGLLGTNSAAEPSQPPAIENHADPRHEPAH